MRGVGIAIVVLLVIGGIGYAKVMGLSLAEVENVGSKTVEVRVEVWFDGEGHDKTTFGPKAIGPHESAFLLYVPGEEDGTLFVACSDADSGQTNEFSIDYVTRLINKVWRIKIDNCSRLVSTDLRFSF